MNITFDQLIECIQQSKKEVEMLVQNDDFYASRGETMTAYVYIIDPDLLIGALQDAEAEAMFEVAENKKPFQPRGE